MGRRGFMTGAPTDGGTEALFWVDWGQSQELLDMLAAQEKSEETLVPGATAWQRVVVKPTGSEPFPTTQRPRNSPNQNGTSSPSISDVRLDSSFECRSQSCHSMIASLHCPLRASMRALLRHALQPDAWCNPSCFLAPEPLPLCCTGNIEAPPDLPPLQLPDNLPSCLHSAADLS